MVGQNDVKMVIPKPPVALVVGGSSGIGQEVAIRLCCEGYRVYNLSRTQFHGEGVRSVSVDVSKSGELRAAIERIGNEEGRIDLLVYSAGFSLLAPVEYARAEDYRYLFEVNYFGAVEGIQAVLPFLLPKRGKIILVGSVACELPIPFHGFYCSSKAALCMLAREANGELRKKGIKVSVVLPRGTATNFSFRRRVYREEECGEYALSVKRAQAALLNEEQGGKAPAFVAERVLKAVKRGNPPVVCTVGASGGLLYRLARLLPVRFIDLFTAKKFHQK